MSQVKPLSKLELREIEYALCAGYQDYARTLVERLLGAEQFWREAVKRTSEFIQIDRTGNRYCQQCDALEGRGGHRRDCPRGLAEEFDGPKLTARQDDGPCIPSKNIHVIPALPISAVISGGAPCQCGTRRVVFKENAWSIVPNNLDI